MALDEIDPAAVVGERGVGEGDVPVDPLGVEPARRLVTATFPAVDELDHELPFSLFGAE